MTLNVAFVGQGFHLKFTKSSQFFTEVLKERFPGLEIWSSEWNWIKFPRKAWDLAVFWQESPDPLLLKSVTIRRLVVVPMEDTFDPNPETWAPCQGALFVCFSRALFERVQSWGHRAVYWQYAPPIPLEEADWSAGPQNLFFWPRKPNLTWKTIEPFVRSSSWARIHLHVTEHPEVFLEGLSEADRAVLPLVQTSWFTDHRAYSRVLAQSQVFLAPRRNEGIGMAFLEAMALGMAVVAPLGPTMNEYIDSGVNGWLYDPENPSIPDWSRAEAWGREARRSLSLVRRRWEVEMPLVLDQFLTLPEGRLDGEWSEAAEARRRPVLRRWRWFALANPLRRVRDWWRSRR